LDLEREIQKVKAQAMKYQSKTKPTVEVEFVAEAQLRIGETKRLCVIYQRGEVFYVRPKAEFFDKFVLDDSQIQS
jgi:trehalose utilization protein